METDLRQNGADHSLCIVLRVVQYAESDLILTLFSRDEGLIDARAYGARSLKSGIRAASQPFCLAEFEFYVKNGRRSVRAADQKNEFFGIQSNFRKYACGCAALELTEKILRGVSEPSEYEDLFRLLVIFLTSLEHFEADPSYILLFFLMRAVNIAGVFPSVDSCVLCGARPTGSNAWSWTHGGAVCSDCTKSVEFDELERDVIVCLATYGRTSPGSVTDMSYSLKTVQKAVKAMYSMLRHQLGITVRAEKLLKP